MNIESVDASHNINKLLQLKPNEDCVWAAVKCDLFTTYNDYCSTNHQTYFGHWDMPFKDTSYSINCIEGKSPKVYKLKKLTYLGKFESKETFDKIFVFTDRSDRDLRFSSYILPFEHGFRTRFNDPPELSSDVFSSIDVTRRLDIELISFNEEDGLKICRELNGCWRNDYRYINFAEQGIYIKKTLKSMLKQLDEFMKSEYMIDYVKAIDNELNSNG